MNKQVTVENIRMGGDKRATEIDMLKMKVMPRMELQGRGYTKHDKGDAGGCCDMRMIQGMGKLNR